MEFTSDDLDRILMDLFNIPCAPASNSTNGNISPTVKEESSSSDEQQQQQQQQGAPPSQSNPAPQPPPFVRIYQTGTPGNISHPYAPTAYQQPPPQTAYIQPGKKYSSVLSNPRN